MMAHAAFDTAYKLLTLSQNHFSFKPYSLGFLEAFESLLSSPFIESL